MSGEKDAVQNNPVADVVESVTLLATPSHQLNKIKGKNKGVIASIPVVIAEPKIQINIESTIRLEDTALDIINIRKNIYLTQCELMSTDEKKSGKLFLSGFIRKNIEYSTVSTVRRDAVSGDIRHTTVNIPFKCFAKVDFAETPEFESNENEIRAETYSGDEMGSSPESFSSRQTERFNQSVQCELLEAAFKEKEIIRNLRSLSSQYLDVNVFDTFVEKLVVDLVIRITQVQPVEIPRVEAAREGGNGGNNGGKGGDREGGEDERKGGGKGGDREGGENERKGGGREGDKENTNRKSGCWKNY